MANRRVGRESGAAMSRALSLAMTALLAWMGVGALRCSASPLEGIAGWEGDRFEQGYGFAMLGTLVAGDSAVSFPVRITGSYLYYNYGEAGGIVKVRGPGGAGLVGIRYAPTWGTVMFLVGGEIRWETRKRELSPGPEAVVARGGVVGEVDGDVAWTRRLHPFWLVNYSGSARYVYGRAGIRFQVSNLDWRGPVTWSVGLDAVGQGNADTDALQGGGSLECVLVRSRLSLNVRGGYKDSASSDGGRRQGGYVGGGVYKRF